MWDSAWFANKERHKQWRLGFRLLTVAVVVMGLGAKLKYHSNFFFENCRLPLHHGHSFGPCWVDTECARINYIVIIISTFLYECAPSYILIINHAMARSLSVPPAATCQWGCSCLPPKLHIERGASHLNNEKLLRHWSDLGRQFHGPFFILIKSSFPS